MLSLGLHKHVNSPLEILCLGAHCDDIEIGCGGSILKLLEQHKRVRVSWVVFSSDDQRAEEAQQSAKMFLSRAESRNIVMKRFRNSFFPYIAGDIKSYFEELKRTISP